MFSRLWKEGSEDSRHVEPVEDQRAANAGDVEAAGEDQNALNEERLLAGRHVPGASGGPSITPGDLQRDEDQGESQRAASQGADSNLPNEAAAAEAADDEYLPEHGDELELDAQESELDVLVGKRLVPAGPRRRKSRLLVKPETATRKPFSPQQRLLLLDTWQRSGLPAKDFSALVGVSAHSLYKWKRLFQQHGPEGLMDQRKGQGKGSRLPEVTKRTILMLKEANPEWGCQRISDALVRGPGLSASAQAIARVLREAGYQSAWEPSRPHRAKPRTFERAKPNQLWQTDLFTFMLKRQNRRVYLVAFMDDHSRFVVSYGLHASASTALVIEAVEAGIANYGVPEEILTDNGPQYITWRGKSKFSKQLEKRGIRQIVAKPKRPQTLGKIERFWGTLWRELIEAAVFVDLTDARQRIGHFLDYYNFQRTHTGIDGLVPADRFFHAAENVKQTLAERVAANALELARQGEPKSPFYVTGQVSGQAFAVHSQGERLVLTRDGQPREEIELTDPPQDQSPSPPAEPICPHAAESSATDEGDSDESCAPESPTKDDDDGKAPEEGGES